MDNLRSWLLIIVIVVLGLMFLSQWITSRAYGRPENTGTDAEKNIRRKSSLRRYVRNRFLFIFFLYAIWIGVYLFKPVWTAKHFDLYLLDFALFQILGFLIACGGIVLNIHSQLRLGRNFRLGIIENDRTELVRSGAYSYLRNPMYAGLLTIQFALIFLMPDTISVSLLLISFLMLEILIRQEEDHLEDLHGAAFEEYRRAVPRYIPLRLIKRALKMKESTPFPAVSSASAELVLHKASGENKPAISPLNETARPNAVPDPVMPEVLSEAVSEENRLEGRTLLSETVIAEPIDDLQTADKTEETADIEIEDIEVEDEKPSGDSADGRMDSLLKKMMQKNRR